MFTKSTFTARRKAVLKQVESTCAFFFAPPPKVVSRDVYYPYRPDSDFYYLTGIEEPNACLILRCQGGKQESILYIQDRDKERERWESPRLGIARARRTIEVDSVRLLEKLPSELEALCTGLERIALPFGVDPECEQMILSMLSNSVHPRFNAPHTVSDSRLLTAPLRFRKDKDEINLIRTACNITAAAFIDTLTALPRLKSEIDVKHAFEHAINIHGGQGTAFNTNAAFGHHTTTLHNTPTKKSAGKNDLLLLDAGAAYAYYASDVTRTVPARSPFTSQARTIYEIVDHARKACIDAVRPGVTLDHLERLAINIISRGLASSKVTKEKAASLIMSRGYRKYFMHGIGHYIGLDTHDVAPYHHPKTHRPIHQRRIPLVPGAVLTIEPGIYIDHGHPKAAKEFHGIGIRIEDTILVTNGGCQVLTKGIPTDPDVLEEVTGVRRRSVATKAK